MSTASSPTGSRSFDRFLLGQLPSGRILNLGSGAGVEVPGRQVINVDHVAFPRVGAELSVVATAEMLPFRDDVFDGALLKDVIEHVDDPIGVLMEAARVAVAGASLTVQVPRAIPRAVWADPTHRRGFTDKAVVQAMRMGGIQPGRPKRIGGFRGAGRLGLIPWLERIMRIPLIGHRYGTNWIVRGYVEAR